ncbi:hypothetical protein BJX62DRAFT_223194 [Aspergillus germanicus]
MIDLSSLSIINNHCKSARSLDRSSPDLFGGLPVVILMGDFCQFPPVRGQPLWKIPQTEAEHVGKLIINRLQIDRFARSRLQKIYIFPALHTRTKSSSPTNLRLHADDLLGLPEQGTTVPSPGLFLYTLGMPIMLLTNVNTPHGLVNGATGAAVGVVVDPVGIAEFHALDDLYIFATKPPACLLFKPNRPNYPDCDHLMDSISYNPLR